MLKAERDFFTGFHGKLRERSFPDCTLPKLASGAGIVKFRTEGDIAACGLYHDEKTAEYFKKPCGVEA
jgi:hypothetical protein